MKWPSKCPVCGGGLREKRVHEVLEEEGNTVILEVGDAVCLNGSKAFYGMENCNSIKGFKILNPYNYLFPQKSQSWRLQVI